jgi:hypothetical protein
MSTQTTNNTSQKRKIEATYGIIFQKHTPEGSLVGIMKMPWSFQETYDRIYALLGPEKFAEVNADVEKTDFNLTGIFRGIRFSLYNYKGI